MSIEQWLDEFRSAWLSKDIDSVLGLFTENVEYWETPFKKFATKEEIATAWKYINTQEDIEISTDVFASAGDKHTVFWDLQYKNAGGNNHWRGMYCIKLNDEGLCEYFFQTGEKE